jgi:DNA primase
MNFPDSFIDWAHNALNESEEAQSYLQSRGTSAEQWKRHRIGYVSSDFEIDPSISMGHSEACSDRQKRSQWCDICRYRRWSSIWEGEEGTLREQHVGRRIVGCIVLPLTSYSGMTVGFQVRSIQNKSYDTFVVSRRPEGYFFGIAANIDEIWHRREVALVEGPFDHLIFERLVMPTVLALTTNIVNPMQMRFLRRFVHRIYICTDRDKAGRDGRYDFVKRTLSEFDIVNVMYPCINEGDKDIGDYWQCVGDNRFSQYFKKELRI